MNVLHNQNRGRGAGTLTDVDVEPHRNARVLVEGERDRQVDPGHALGLVEVTPERKYERFHAMPEAPGNKEYNRRPRKAD